MLSAESTLCTASAIAWFELNALPQVAQVGRVAAKAPSLAARSRLPEMLKARPNQKIATSTKKIIGSTKAASAISWPSVPIMVLGHFIGKQRGHQRWISRCPVPYRITVKATATPKGTLSDSGLSSVSSGPGSLKLNNAASIRPILRAAWTTRRL